MSFWKKLLGKKPETTSIERLPRIPVQPHHRLSFFGKEKPADHLKLRNISTGGLGLTSPKSEGEQFAPKTTLQGDLKFEKIVFPVSLEVRHNSPRLIGCAFLQPATDLQGHIEGFFNYELTATKLNEVSPSLLQENPDGKVVWFTDSNANEVYMVHRAGELKRFHISFLGNYIEGADGTLRYGYVEEDDRSQNVSYKGSNLVRFLDQPDSSFDVLAMRFLHGIEKLPLELRVQILSRLRLRAT